MRDECQNVRIRFMLRARAICSPRNAFGIVIFSHCLSLISRPESGEAIIFAMPNISISRLSGAFSNANGRSESGIEFVIEELVDVNVLTDGARSG